jgi:arsenite methyltransferase
VTRGDLSGASAVHDRVRRRYAAVARTLLAPRGHQRGRSAAGGSSSVLPVPVLESGDAFGPRHYTAAVRRSLPQLVVAASLGCGDPVSRARLGPGARVLDLGCGGGIDAMLAASEVGDSGHVIGLDLTFDMLAVARRGVEAVAIHNVSLVQAAIEQLPLADGVLDAVISNSVIHFAYDKAVVFAEAYRVLRHPGSLVVVDLVTDDGLDTCAQAERADDVGWTTGGLGPAEYRRLLGEAGFVEVTVDLLHQVADRMHAAVISAMKPGPVVSGW